MSWPQDHSAGESTAAVSSMEVMDTHIIIKEQPQPLRLPQYLIHLQLRQLLAFMISKLSWLNTPCSNITRQH